MRRLKSGNGQASARNRISRSYSDRIFDIVNLFVMLVLLVVYTLAQLLGLFTLGWLLGKGFGSLVWMGNVVLWPKGFTLISYETLLEYKRIWVGYGNTLFYTVVGTLVNLVMTVCGAYPLSRKDFMPRHFFMFLFMLTMYFSGGLIPFYMVIKKLSLTNTRTLMVIISTVAVYNIIITRSFLESNLPEELRDAARVDGCGNVRFFAKIVLPLSRAIIAVLVLYIAVAYWDSYFNPMIFLTDRSKYPLAVYLREILLTAGTGAANSVASDAESAQRLQTMVQVIKYGVIVVSTLPIVCVYPFLQKYFMKGVMIGSIKG